MFVHLIEELMGESIDVLDQKLAAAQRKRNEAELEMAAIAAVVDSQQLFNDHGHRSLTGYLQHQLNCPASTAQRIKQRGRLFNQHPEIGDGLGATRFGTAQVDLLANAFKHPVAGQRFAEFAPLLTEHAEHLEYTQFATAVKQFTIQADPDGSFDDQKFHEEHRAASVSEHDGSVSVYASGGDPIRAAEMAAVFRRAVEVEFDNDCAARRLEHGDDALAHPLPRTAAQRQFDALHQIFLAWTTAPADGKRPEPLVNIVIDVATGIDVLARHGLLDVDNATGDESDPIPDPATRRCSTSTGTPLHPDVALAAMVRGSVRRVVVDAHDVVINMGRRQRLFTGKARDAAKLLAVSCGHRGCNVPAEFCDVDHVAEWAADDGTTDQDNAFLVCNVHDRWKHRQRLRGRRDHRGRVHLVKPDGTVIKPLGARDPIWAEPDVPDDLQVA